jgi:hypothetical protein
MRDASKLRIVGRAILLGSLIGVGTVGCTVPEGGQALTEQQRSQRDIAYNQALMSRDPAQVTQFLQAYGGSSQAARLLNQMPPEVLDGVPRTAVVGLPNSVKQQLTPRVRGQFGIALASDDGGSAGSTSVGYGG